MPISLTRKLGQRCICVCMIVSVRLITLIRLMAKKKKASGWVRQVGTHSHFKAGSSKTHARTAITQVGADLIRNEANEDWKYVGGVFAGGLPQSRKYSFLG